MKGGKGMAKGKKKKCETLCRRGNERKEVRDRRPTTDYRLPTTSYDLFKNLLKSGLF